jgi:phosphoribosylformylglycinamidine synthase
MAMRGGTGFQVTAPEGAGHRWLFAESASRAVVCVLEDDADDALERARSAQVPARRLGAAGGDRLIVEGLCDVGLEDAVGAWHGRLPEAFGAGATH